MIREKLERGREYYAIDKAMKERMSAVMDRTKHLNKLTNVMQEMESKEEQSATNNVNVTTKSYKVEWHQEGGQEVKKAFKTCVESQDEIAKKYKIDGEDAEADIAAIGDME